MYDCRGREMYYVDEKQKQVDLRTLSRLDLFRLDSECVFGVVVCVVVIFYIIIYRCHQGHHFLIQIKLYDSQRELKNVNWPWQERELLRID